MRKIGYAAAVEKQKVLVKASIKLQVITIIITCVILSFWTNIGFACSAGLGGLCAFLPNLTALRWHFRRPNVLSANKMLANIYLAEALKFVLIVLLLAIVYGLAVNQPLLSATGVLIGFMLTYFSTLLMPLLAK